MKKQYVAPAEKLTAHFNEQKKGYETFYEGSGLDAVLEALSKAMYDLNEIGIDVQLQLNHSLGEEVWTMIDKVNGTSVSSSVSLTGVLKIDQDERLFAVSHKENEEPVRKIYVSNRNYASRRLSHDFRGTSFDLNNDSEAIYKFQQLIIDIAAENETIRNHDVHESFNKEAPAKLQKNSAPSLTAPKPPRL